ncbi:unnamed protein product [Rhizophagus irregularis]|nr:unnamed protein product [Rhizophagus irregularis]
MAYNSFSSFTSMGLFYLILKGELNLLLKNKEYSDLREIRENESSYGIEDDLMPEISNYTIDTLPYEPLLSLKEGYKTHKKGEAWKCYVRHTNNENFHANIGRDTIYLSVLMVKLIKKKV